MASPKRPSLRKEDIEYIKEMRSSKKRLKITGREDERSLRNLALRFNVSRTTICFAAKGRYDHHYEASNV